jgi:hypothetical protein
MRCGLAGGGMRFKYVQTKCRLFSSLLLTNQTQECLPVGATLAPVILATDKTSLTQFTGGKNAYPVYLTLGNIPKAIR